MPNLLYQKSKLQTDGKSTGMYCYYLQVFRFTNRPPACGLMSLSTISMLRVSGSEFVLYNFFHYRDHDEISIFASIKISEFFYALDSLLELHVRENVGSVASY